MRKSWLFLGAVPLLIAAIPTGSVPPPLRIVPEAASLTPTDEIGLLTYNVQDLPWPIAGDRAGPLIAIGERLRALRAQGRAPQFVVLQEAFSGKSIRMLRAAGYAHFVTGPAADTPRGAPAEPLGESFLKARSRLIGERMGPALSSGIAIASDYPILAAASEPFPADVCAGIDCLANKGVLLARIAVPGLAQPVELITTHMNSGRKSRTPPAHHLHAYAHQLKAIDRFLARHGDQRALRLFAGDVNVSHSPQRLKLLTRHAARWGVVPVTAMGKPEDVGPCARPHALCTRRLPIDSNVPLVHTLDWQFADKDAPFRAIARDVPFGAERGGTMLSDHIGYAVRYKIKPMKRRAEVTLSF
jgi:hypothetical protein